MRRRRDFERAPRGREARAPRRVEGSSRCRASGSTGGRRGGGPGHSASPFKHRDSSATDERRAHLHPVEERRLGRTSVQRDDHRVGPGGATRSKSAASPAPGRVNRPVEPESTRTRPRRGRRRPMEVGADEPRAPRARIPRSVCETTGAEVHRDPLERELESRDDKRPRTRLAATPRTAASGSPRRDSSADRSIRGLRP